MKAAEKILAEDLIFLDCALTGAKFKTALHTWENSDIKHPLDFILKPSACYYLSDGGYSRLYIACTDDTETVSLCIDSVSTKKVKEAWKRCIELRTDLEHTVKVALKLENMENQ
jgi:hypothetical protein